MNFKYARVSVLTVALLIAGSVGAIQTKIVRPLPEYARVAQLFSDIFPKSHLEHTPIDDLAAVRAFDQFINSLDFDRVYFLESDISKFREEIPRMAGQLTKGDVDFAYRVFAIFKERVNNRYEFVKQLLPQGFDLSVEESYKWKRKNENWAESEAAWNEIWRKRIKNEYLQRYVRKKLGDESRAKTAATAGTKPPVGVGQASGSAPKPGVVAPGTEPAVAVVIEPTTPTEKMPAEKTVPGEKAPAELTTAEKTPAEKTPAEKTPAEKTPAESTAAEKTPAEKKAAEKKPHAAAEEDDVAADDTSLTPEANILKQYEQFVTVLNDDEEEWVLQRYLSAFTHAYDPHSDFMSPTAMTDFNIEMKLSLVGIGALLRATDGMAEIIRLIPAGPAERQGELQPGDKIIAVGEGDEKPVSIVHWPLSKTVTLIRGQKGSIVTLVVVPAADTTGTLTKKIRIERDIVKLEEQAAKGEVHEIGASDGAPRKIGLIRLPAFYVDLKAKSSGDESQPDFRSSARDVRDILKDLEKKSVDAVILDLRNNGGGSLLEAIELTGLFVESGPIVQVKEQRRISVLTDPDPQILYAGPLIVMVNRLSASASEILAGALQDYGRAIIVGDSRTHGKGTVQTVLQLDQADPTMGSIKVTTASFYRILGGSTQLKGITSDILVPSQYDSMDIGEGSLDNPLKWTMVNPVRFRPFADLRPMIADLRAKSDARCAADAAYTKRRDLMKQLSALREVEDISLKFDDAMGIARTEQRLLDVQKEATTGISTNSVSGDYVLSETLEIMGDYLKALDAQKTVKQ